MWNNGFDLAILHWLNQFASGSVKLNHLVYFISDVNLFKGLPMMAMLWFFWFRSADERSGSRQQVQDDGRGPPAGGARGAPLGGFTRGTPRPRG